MTGSVLSNVFRGFVAFLALGVTFYAIRFVIVGEAGFTGPVHQPFTQRPWAIFTHAAFGGLALAFAAAQMSRTIRTRQPNVHRWMGRVTVPAALISGLAGLYLAFYSYGGLVTHLGFGGLAVSTIVCATMGWLAIRAKNVPLHREWMLRTFLLLFSAVTLRLELGILTSVFSGLQSAYLIVSWLCWVPNLILAEVLIWRSR